MQQGEGLEVSTQKAVLGSLHRVLKNNARGFHLLSGPSGTGKTWLADRLGNMLEQSDNWKIMTCRCSELGAFQPYSSIELSLLQAQTESFVERGSKFASTAMGDIPFVGNTASAALSALMEMHQNKGNIPSQLIPKHMQSVWFRVQKLFGNQRGLIIVDDAHWLDESSREFFLTLARSDILRLSGFWNRLHVLFIATPEQIGETTSKFSMTLNMEAADAVELSACTEVEFSNALHHFGLDQGIDAEIVAHIYKITKGHLNIARHIVDFVNEKNAFNANGFASTQGIVSIAINHKLKSLGTFGSDIADLLSKAVVIGNNFTVNELSCLSGVDLHRVRQILDNAEHGQLVHRRGSHVRFSHEIIKEHFNGIASSPSTKADHEKFAECVQLIRPSLYGLRADHLYRAELTEDSAVLYIADGLSRIRNGDGNAWNYVFKILKNRAENLIPIWKCFKIGIEHFNCGEYEQACTVFSELNAITPSLLSGEAALLWGRALMKSSNSNEKARAVEVLAIALSLQDESEVDLWGRLALYLSVAQAYAGQVHQARETGKRLCRVMEKRLGFDRSALTLLNRFRLRADMFFSDDIAAAEIGEARRSLIPADSEIADPVQGYIALCNSAGNALYRGNFQDAQNYCSIAEELVKSNNIVTFPRLDILINNHILAVWLSGGMSTAEFSREMESLCQFAVTTNDTGILFNNFSVGLALNGRADEALAVLRPEYEKFAVDGNQDYFDQYFLGNNIAGFLYNLGLREDAAHTWNSLADLPQKLPYSIREFMLLRHSVLTKIINGENIGKSWDEFPRSDLEYRIGSQWQFFGRGFLVSELQFWSDE